MLTLLLKIFAAFFLIGMFTVGGGYAVIGIIQSEIVVARGWISESLFTDIVAISQMTPGPVGLNCSTYVGYEVMHQAGAGALLSTIGSATASLAVVLPSFFIMLLIVKCYRKFHENPVFEGVMQALRPTVAGLLGAAAAVLTFSIGPDGVSLIRDNFPDWKSALIAAAAAAAYMIWKVSPIKLIGGGALLGIILYI